VTPPSVPSAGLVPATETRTAIGGAPPPLLRAAEGTFLARALGRLRAAGMAEVIVTVPDARGPVAAEARRGGAEIVVVEGPGEGSAPEPLRSLEAAARHSRAEGWIVLPPAFPLVRESTPAALLEAWAHAGPEVRAIVPVLAPAVPAPQAERPGWDAAAPIVVRGDQVEALPDLPGSLGAEALLRVPVEDPGIGIRVDTLALYRRHFPEVYRRRFQKW
jgi:CTP:molybdopterin cytidylyltransferase MocA